jgi:hypothetical protein
MQVMTDTPFSKPEISQTKLTKLIKNSKTLNTSENEDQTDYRNKRITIEAVSYELLLDIDNTLSKIKEWVDKDILIEDGYYLLENHFNSRDQYPKGAAKIPHWRISRRYAHLLNPNINTVLQNFTKDTIQYIASHLALIISSEGFESNGIIIRIAGNPALSKKSKGTVIISIEVAEELTKERERELWHYINNEIFAKMIVEYELRGFRPIHICSKGKTLSDFANEHRVLFRNGDICWQQDQINASKFYDKEYKLSLAYYEGISKSSTLDRMSIYYINSKEDEEYLLSIPAYNASCDFDYALNIMSSDEYKEITRREIDEPYLSKCAIIAYIYFTHVMRTKKHFLFSSPSIHSFQKLYTSVDAEHTLYAIEKMRDTNNQIQKRVTESKERDNKNSLKNEGKLSYALFDISSHKIPKLFALAEITNKDKTTLKNISREYNYDQKGADNAVVCLPCNDNEKQLLERIQIHSKSKTKGFFIYNNGYEPKGRYTSYAKSNHWLNKITTFKTKINERDISESFFILPWHYKNNIDTPDILTKNILIENDLFSETIFICNLLKKESRTLLDSYGIPSFRHFCFLIKDSKPTITYNGHLHDNITVIIEQEKIIFSINNEVILDINTDPTKKYSHNGHVATALSTLLNAMNEALSIKILSTDDDYKELLSYRMEREMERYGVT